MSRMLTLLPPEVWMQQVFDAKAAREGGIVRRSLRDVDRAVGRDAVLGEVARRGFQAIETAGQVVVICNAQPIRRLV